MNAHPDANTFTRLIVIAVVVELVRRLLFCLISYADWILQGEIVARLIVHATMREEIGLPKVLSKEEALRTLERMMIQS
jgi:hypothetical protein